jgi:hypothetical protein
VPGFRERWEGGVEHEEMIDFTIKEVQEEVDDERLERRKVNGQKENKGISIYQSENLHSSETKKTVEEKGEVNKEQEKMETDTYQSTNPCAFKIVESKAQQHNQQHILKPSITFISRLQHGLDEKTPSNTRSYNIVLVVDGCRWWGEYYEIENSVQ